VGCVWAFWIGIVPAVQPAAAQEGNSPFNPAPAGVRLSGIVECGQGYTSHELYDMNITLLEVARGDDAWKILKEAEVPTSRPMKALITFWPV
jgi:hypothetical protein